MATRKPQWVKFQDAISKVREHRNNLSFDEARNLLLLRMSQRRIEIRNSSWTYSQNQLQPKAPDGNALEPEDALREFVGVLHVWALGRQLTGLEFSFTHCDWHRGEFEFSVSDPVSHLRDRKYYSEGVEIRLRDLEKAIPASKIVEAHTPEQSIRNRTEQLESTPVRRAGRPMSHDHAYAISHAVLKLASEEKRPAEIKLEVVIELLEGFYQGSHPKNRAPDRKTLEQMATKIRRAFPSRSE